MGKKTNPTVQLIPDKRYRQVVFKKRKTNLIKKAHELSVLTGTEVALIVFNPQGKVIQYASQDIDQTLMNFTNLIPAESRCNKDFIDYMKRLGKEVLLEDGDDEDEDGDVEGFKDPFTTAAPNSNSPTLSSPTGNSGGMRLQSNPTTSAISSPPLRSPLKSRGAAGGLSLPIPALDSTTTGPHQLMSANPFSPRPGDFFAPFAGGAMDVNSLMFSPSAAAFSGIPFSPINTSGFAAWPAVAQQQTYQQQQQQQQQDFYAGGSAFNRLNAEKAPQTTNGPLKMAARKQQSNSEQQNDFNLSSVPNNISGRRTSLSRTAKRGRLAM